jgi:short subunit dehydrogenase-like uncharacterized protein
LVPPVSPGGSSWNTLPKIIQSAPPENYPVGAPIRWAIAGRNREKLESVLAEYCTAGELPSVIVADSHDSDALAQLARGTRVVLTTVGPYAKYGSELVGACVANGTHYCDLAG